MNDAEDFNHDPLILYQINNAVGMMKYFSDVFSFILRNYSTLLGMRYNTFSSFDNFFDGSAGIQSRIFCNVIKDLIELFLGLLCPSDSHLVN